MRKREWNSGKFFNKASYITSLIYTMKIDPAFLKQISYLDIESITNSQDTICVIDNHLKLRAYNDAWVKFAENNDGETILEIYPLGCKITEAGAEPIKSYISKSYQNALDKNEIFSQEYECSSPHKFRIFQQMAYPLIESRGLLISHHQVVELPHALNEVEFSSIFSSEHEIITQCANCRKIRDPKNEHIWFWVPSLIKFPLPNISHSICTPCLDYYYPNIDEE